MDLHLAIFGDASYLFAKRATDITNLRRMYSVHKGRPLTKFMVYCGNDGYFFEISGAWATNGAHNDANILKIETAENTKLAEFLGICINNGITVKFFCDRGFRDAVHPLNNMLKNQVQVMIPPLQNDEISAKDKKASDKYRNKGNVFSREKSDEARHITTERSVVERANELIKNGNFFEILQI